MPKKSKKILMLGPFPEPTTGVSLANKVAKEILDRSELYKVNTVNTSYNRFDENIGKFSFHKLFFFLSFYLRFYKVFQNDIVYITPGQSFFGVAKYALFIVFSKLFGKELILHIHGNHLGTEYRLLTGWKKKFFRYLLAKTDKGIVLSESLNGNMNPFIAEEKIFVLYNFAEDFLIENDHSSSSDQLRIIYLSNLMEEKGIFYLLKALQMLEDQGVPYKAKIAGAIDAANKNRVKDGFKNLNHAEYVGIVKGEDKKALLQWGNVFVLPTFYPMEGQPISILEAMASHNVIVTTRHAGIPDIVKEGINGYFVEKQDSTELKDCLIQLQQNPNDRQRIVTHNRKEFAEKYTVDHFGERLLFIINQ